ncbi:MAG: M3 family peptidase, partial [Asticcacaulis sp.]
MPASDMNRRTTLTLMACTGASALLAGSAAAQGGAAIATAYLTQPWTGPYGGVPPFDKVKIADFEPAMLAAMDTTRAEIKALTMKRSAPTFETIIEPFERSGADYGRVSSVYSVWDSSLSS